MSRIGKMPITLPAKVSISVDKGNLVTVSGPKGQLKQQFDPDIKIEVENNQIKVQRPTDQREHRAQHGLTRALLANMVQGVSTGFSRRLEIRGVGYRAEKRGSNLVLSVGKSHPVEFAPPSADIAFDVDKDGRAFTITGIDKARIGELAAEIRRARPPEPYQGKGIRYEGEYVRQKAGKTGKAGKK
ncbi:MAG TPA: 50S ribosomal protein L6 [Chloroflexi bacterium]|nr:50S ribosomal protein L6 [Chloroflexota bacterium]HHW84818.1 50S ribosomal protein L6 [Chloroflexota bacterium]